MRTTLDLDDTLLREAKKRAADSRSTLTRFIEDALRLRLAPPPGAPRRRRARLPVFRGNGPRPGVDLDSSSALLDQMEGRP